VKASKSSLSLATFLRAARLRAGYSQAEVARKMGYTTAQFVSNWERGVSSPPMRALKKLAELYRVKADEIYEALLTYTLQKTKEDLERQFYGRNRRSARASGSTRALTAGKSRAQA
jgi:transcriptional regulator with XRE-family HTH domain